MVLKEAFGYVGRLIESIDDQKLQEEIEFGGVKMPKENIFYLMRDHATHHRAQAILYLRMNEIEPPDTGAGNGQMEALNSLRAIVLKAAVKQISFLFPRPDTT